jgi:hypothetical protein
MLAVEVAVVEPLLVIQVQQAVMVVVEQVVQMLTETLALPIQAAAVAVLMEIIHQAQVKTAQVAQVEAV